MKETVAALVAQCLLFQSALADRAEGVGINIIEVRAKGGQLRDTSKVTNGGTTMLSEYEAPFAFLEQRSQTTDKHCCCVVEEAEPVTDDNKVTTRGIAKDCKDGAVITVEGKDQVAPCPDGTKNVFITTGPGVSWPCKTGPSAAKVAEMEYRVLDPKKYTDVTPYYTNEAENKKENKKGAPSKGRDHPKATETAYGVVDPLEIHPIRHQKGNNYYVAERPTENFGPRSNREHATEQLETAQAAQKDPKSTAAEKYPEYKGEWGDRTKAVKK
mmetsp:Transcript_11184/g.12482  ORF Transcript_11184/g.12482 Transcript_11184/m.12482 type:complete len:271 (-) Transcript_11184:83-895(-)